MTIERSHRYENWLIVMAFFATGCILIDRFAALYLSPLFVKDLHMTQAEVGAVIGFLSVSWGISGWVFGSLSDKYGRQSSGDLRPRQTLGAGLQSSCRPGHGCGSGIGWGTDVTDRAPVDSLAAATDIQHAPTSVRMTTRPIEIR